MAFSLNPETGRCLPQDPKMLGETRRMESALAEAIEALEQPAMVGINRPESSPAAALAGPSALLQPALTAICERHRAQVRRVDAMQSCLNRHTFAEDLYHVLECNPLRIDRPLVICVDRLDLLDREQDRDYIVSFLQYVRVRPTVAMALDRREIRLETRRALFVMTMTAFPPYDPIEGFATEASSVTADLLNSGIFTHFAPVGPAGDTNDGLVRLQRAVQDAYGLRLVFSEEAMAFLASEHRLLRRAVTGLHALARQAHSRGDSHLRVAFHDILDSLS